jgi:hypothetical protein
MLKAANHDHLKIINDLVDWQLPRNNDEARHFFASLNPICRVRWHRFPVMSNDYASGFRRSFQQFGVSGFTQASFIRGYSIQIRDTSFKPAQNIVIQILIYE